jgi:acyl carrier protein
MTPEDLRAALLEELARSAPEADLTTLRDDAPLRETLDLDSFDFLTLVGRLETRLGVRVPDTDYPKLDSLAKAVAYLTARLPGR